jgi:hypothetical protein
MADEVGTGIDAEIAAVERTLSDLKAKRASKAQLEATRREGSKPLEGDHTDSQPLDTSCDPPKPARRPDGSKLRFVKQRARFSAVSGALGELRGQHVDMDIEEADAKALPQLNPRIESQFRWLQFMVWRRWMAGAALAISLCILAVTIWNTMLKFNIQQDQISRCREGGLNGFEATYDPPQAASTVLDDMIKPFETAQVWHQLHCRRGPGSVSGRMPLGAVRSLRNNDARSTRRRRQQHGQQQHQHQQPVCVPPGRRDAVPGVLPKGRCRLPRLAPHTARAAAELRVRDQLAGKRPPLIVASVHTPRPRPAPPCPHLQSPCRSLRATNG